MLAVRKIGQGIGNIEVQEVPEPQAGPEQVLDPLRALDKASRFV
jgi:hypothetical protein